jgi:hypothetical protein
MKVQKPFREPARILLHLDAGYTLIELTRLGWRWEIPTRIIPYALRPLCSKLLIVAPRFTVEASDSADDIRWMIASLQILELPDQDDFTKF